MKGFTLVELIVVIGMISALAGMFALNASSVRADRNLDIAVNDLVSVLREAQAWGGAGRVFGTGADKFDLGYGVYIPDPASDPTSVVLYGGEGVGTLPRDSCYLNGGAMTLISQNVKTVQLPRGITVSATTDIAPAKDVHILFRRGEPEVNIYDTNCNSGAGSREDSVGIVLSNGSETRIVHVNKYGLIYAD